MPVLEAEEGGLLLIKNRNWHKNYIVMQSTCIGRRKRGCQKASAWLSSRVLACPVISQRLPGCVPLRWTEQPSSRNWMIMRVTDGDAGRSCQKQHFALLSSCLLLCHASFPYASVVPYLISQRQNTGNRMFQNEDEVVHLQQGHLITGASKIGHKKMGQLQIFGVGVNWSCYKKWC